VKEPVSLCADAAAGWHASWLKAFGLRFVKNEDAWRALDAPHFIYFAGITLRPDAPAEAVAEAPGTVCDSWCTLDLSPFGFEVTGSDRWFCRPAGALPAAKAPGELEIVRVTTPAGVEEFEAVSVRGFTQEEATIEPRSVHPPAVLDDPAMVLWLGRVEGQPVSAAMSYRTDEAVGIFGVTTVASARQRGYATALTRAAILAENSLPSVLATNSPVAAPIYQRLGHRPVGELRMWLRAHPAR
jgi:hypothetical protein